MWRLSGRKEAIQVDKRKMHVCTFSVFPLQYLSVCQSLSVYRSIDLAIYLSIYPSIHLRNTIYLYLSIYATLAIYLSIYLRNTELSKYISFWYLNLPKCKVPRGILKHDATSYNPTSNRCNLCLWEKYFRICKPDLASLNKRNELISSCRPTGKYALKNFRP